MHAQRAQACLLAAMTAAAGLQCHLGKDPTEIVCYLGLMALSWLALALLYDVHDRRCQHLSVAIWLAHLVLGLVFASGMGFPPSLLVRRRGVTELGLLIQSVVLQGFAGEVLPLWLVLLIAEVHALTQWMALLQSQPKWEQPLQRLLLTQLAAVVLPTILHRGRWGHRSNTGHDRLPAAEHIKAVGSGKAAGGTDVHHGQESQKGPPAADSGTSGAAAGSSKPAGGEVGGGAAGCAELQHATQPGEQACAGGCGSSHAPGVTTTPATSPGAAPLAAVPAANSTVLRTSPGPTPLAYTSILGGRMMVCAKIATHHHPESLRPGALDKLARAVERLGSRAGSSFTVVSASVRHGCILITLDVRNIPPPPSAPATILPPSSPTTSGLSASSSTATGGTGQGSAEAAAAAAAAQALDCAQQLLPGLLQQLGLCGDGSGCGAVMEPGQYLQLQLGGHLVQATIHPQSGEWVFSARAVEWDSSSSSSGSSGLPMLWARPCPAPAPSTSLPAGVHMAVIQVQVWCGDAAALPVVVGSSPGGSNLPAGPAGAAASGSSGKSQQPSLQLWVHCQGQYLQTSVNTNAVGSGAGPAVVWAAVHLPSTVLSRHHQPGGPAARLQLLTAEVWTGESLLSSTPLLLNAARHLQPPAAPAAPTFGWWGVAAAPAAGMVEEVAALAERLQVAATELGAEERVQSTHAFVCDLAAWLSAMQHAAPGTCCDMCPPAPPQQFTTCGLGPDECQTLALSLRIHATACSLPNTCAVLQSQSARVLSPWQGAAQHPSSTAPSSRGRGTTTAPALQWTCTKAYQLAAWAACAGHCPACDSIYYDRLRAYLHRLWLFTKILRVSGSCIVLAQEWSHLGPSPLTCILSVWTLMHMLTLLACTQPGYHDVPPPARPTSQGWPAGCKHWLVHAGGLHIIARYLRLLMACCLAARLSVYPAPACRPLTLAIHVVPDAIFTLLTEQVHTWGRYPQWLSVVEFLLLTQTGWSCPDAGKAWFKGLWALRCSLNLVLPPVLNAYWRHLLAPARLAPTAALPVPGSSSSNSGGKIKQVHAHAD